MGGMDLDQYTHTAQYYHSLLGSSEYGAEIQHAAVHLSNGEHGVMH